MKTKNILTILIVVAVTFIYSEATVLLTPLVISVITLNEFRKSDIAKYIGFFSLKPVFMMLYSMWLANYGFLRPLYAIYPEEIISAIFWIVPELILTLGIVYSFRHLFGTDKLIWLFLIGDTIRWSSIVIEFLVPDPFPEPYFYIQLYISYFFLWTFPSFYAIVGFISVRERVLNESVNH